MDNAWLQQAMMAPPDCRNLSGQQLAVFQGHQSEVKDVSFSPDGQRLTTIGADGTVRIWSLSGKQLEEFKGYPTSIRGVSFSPDGQHLAIVDETIQLWNLSGKKLAEFKRNQEPIRNVSFSPDGKQFATAGFDGTIRL